MPYIHPTAEVDLSVILEEGVKIWNQAQVRAGAVLGANTIVGKNAFVDLHVRVGKNCKIQNNSCIYMGAELEDGVFVGPHAVLTNDKFPRAINPDGTQKKLGDWKLGKTVVRYGASIGSGAVILPDLEIGRFAMIGACSVVTHSVPEFAMVVGVPARIVGYVNELGQLVRREEELKADDHLTDCKLAGIFKA